MARLPQQYASLVYYSGGDHDGRRNRDRNSPVDGFQYAICGGMVICLGNILFDHVAGRGLRCAVHSALCLGPDGFYGWRWLELTLLAQRVDSLRCQDLDADGGEADMPRVSGAYRLTTVLEKIFACPFKHD